MKVVEDLNLEMSRPQIFFVCKGCVQTHRNEPREGSSSSVMQVQTQTIRKMLPKVPSLVSTVSFGIRFVTAT